MSRLEQRQVVLKVTGILQNLKIAFRLNYFNTTPDIMATIIIGYETEQGVYWQKVRVRNKHQMLTVTNEQECTNSLLRPNQANVSHSPIEIYQYKQNAAVYTILEQLVAVQDQRGFKKFLYAGSQNEEVECDVEDIIINLVDRRNAFMAQIDVYESLTLGMSREVVDDMSLYNELVDEDFQALYTRW